MELYINFLNEHLWLFYSITFLFGLILGSFLNVVIYRLPKIILNNCLYDCSDFLQIPPPAEAAKKYQLNNTQLGNNSLYALSWPDSHCPVCLNKINFYDNIPIISYILLRGKCRNCNTHISWRYPAIELLTAFLLTINAIYLGVSVALLASIILTAALIAASFIDIEYQIIPDELNIPLLWLGIIINYFWQIFCQPTSSLLGAIFGYLILWSFYYIFKFFTGKEGIGAGDFKLLAALGAWLGWQMLPAIIFLGSLLGAIVGVGWLMLTKPENGRNTPIPFGPFLAIFGWICLLFGDTINTTYLNWVN